MALTTAQQALLLFKKWLGLGQTTASREFFNETSYPGRSAVYTNQIWTQADLIPTTAPVLSSSVSSGVVQYWQDITLGSAPGTTTAFTSSLLVDAIPFNYGDGTSYNYTLKDSTNATIAFGQGDWIVDTDAGLVTFYSTVPSNMPPKISFYKYVGAKGFTSSSVAITGSFAGNLIGTSSFALTASYVSGAASTWDTITGKPSGLVSSSLQINTGSFSGSFTGTLIGTSSWAQNSISSSLATNNIVTASVVDTTITFTKGNGSQFSVTVAQSGSVSSASYASTAQNAFTASLAITASYAVSASFAPTILPSGVVSSSLQINTGSFSGSFTGTLVGTSSWATAVITASFATFAVTASYFTGSVDFTNGLIVTGSVVATGGFTGSLSGSATTAVSSSFATTASYALNSTGATFPFSGNAVITGSLYITGSSAAMFTLASGGANYSARYDGSYFIFNANGASHRFRINDGDSVIFTGGNGEFSPDVNNSISLGNPIWRWKNTYTNNMFVSGTNTQTGSLNILSGSINITNGGVTSSLFGTASWASNSISASFATSASIAVTASFAPTILPSGVVSSSTQINTGSFTGSFVGTLTGTASWATAAQTASYFNGFINFPTGLDVTGSLTVTGSTIITGSLGVTGGIIGSLLGTSSWAVSSSRTTTASFAISSSYTLTSSFANSALTASYISGGVSFPSGLDVTGSLNVSGSITGSLLGTSSWAQNAVSASYAPGSPSVSASYAETSSYALLAQNVLGSITSASYALTASYALNSTPGSTFPFSGSAVVTGSLLITGSGLILSGADNAQVLQVTNGSINGGMYASTTAGYFRIGAFNSDVGILVQNSQIYSYTPVGFFANDTNTRDLGSSTLRWKTLFTTNVSASGAISASSAQIPSITGSLQGTASVATTALTASSFTGYLTFPNGLDVTGSTVLTGSGYVLQVLGSASIANNLLVNGGSLFVDAANNRVAIGTTGSISNTLHVQGTVSASSYTSSINNAVGFLGTASWATTATTASLSTTASLALAVSGSGSRVLYNSANNVTTTSANLIFDGTNLTVGGQLNASTKSFVIDHKQLPGKKLVYGVVEGPEHSVMARGRITQTNKIHLPEEWEWLVDMNTITVQLTSIGTFQQLYVDSIDGLDITVRSAGQWNTDIDCFYLVQATRKDVEPLQTVV